ncbi:MAG: hypothetical protein DHS20C12_11840 [Pseudohongiella sp.]|nr:MAG: hypothetical protein DHS20C12_11840 [Pseudohongiella sp.]
MAIAIKERPEKVIDMEIVDLLKIVVPIIVTLCGTVIVMMRWSIERQQKNSEHVWSVLQKSLLQSITQVSRDLQAHKKGNHQWKTKHADKLQELEKQLSAFQTEVAGDYIKRQDWHEHALNLERKMDELRRDINKEIGNVYEKLSQNN